MNWLFAFELGREFKLSIAELLSVFPTGNTIFCDKNICILGNISKEMILSQAKRLGWSIKIMEVWEYFTDYEDILQTALPLAQHEWKFTYALNHYGKQENLKNLLKLSKTVIKSHNLNPRFVNTDFKNVSSVVIVKEGLVKKWCDFNFIVGDGVIYFGSSIFVQDIYGYSNRDYGKDRDMNIGMLPPKLAQMMLNIAIKDQKVQHIYDPFVWLGTVLIEAGFMGYTQLSGSDLNPRMVETSKENLKKWKFPSSPNTNIFLQNAKYIHEVSALKNIDIITTEWYLWEVMTKNNINLERIQKQTEKLADLYEWFFDGLKKAGFSWTLCISFPFWEIKGKYVYFNEIYDILEKYCRVLPLLPDDYIFTPSKSGSLLYKRDAQLVGREIFCLQIK